MKQRRPTLRTVTRQLRDLLHLQSFSDLADIVGAAHEREIRDKARQPQRDRRRKVPA
ncbi:MAG: hypothetical protein K2R98_08405 [Gemmataceae bacterium]|nr:hypothetical protein [Gemmataceae bacterium]